MILLDTNVVSELWRPMPNLLVMDWVDSHPQQAQYLCTPVVAELRFGIERMADSARKDRLMAAAERLFQGFRGRILSFDMAAAQEYAVLGVHRERIGRRLEPMDAMIAAVARANRMALATRNINDFADAGLDLVNPFVPIPG